MNGKVWIDDHFKEGRNTTSIINMSDRVAYDIQLLQTKINAYVHALARVYECVKRMLCIDVTQ